MIFCLWAVSLTTREQWLLSARADAVLSQEEKQSFPRQEHPRPPPAKSPKPDLLLLFSLTPLASRFSFPDFYYFYFLLPLAYCVPSMGVNKHFGFSFAVKSYPALFLNQEQWQWRVCCSDVLISLKLKFVLQKARTLSCAQDQACIQYSLHSCLYSH